MKKNGAKMTMWIAVIILAVIIIGIVVFFNAPYSKTKSEFNQAVLHQIDKSEVVHDVFTVEEVKRLPYPVRSYFEYSGYLNNPKMAYLKADFRNVDFIMSPDKPSIKISYTQYNFVHEPIRLAYIDTSMYGIPFQGLDAYVDGEGSMKGVLAKVIKLFDQKGEEMNKACLVTFLSESLIFPNAALQPYITWEEVDRTHAQATISYKGVSASGLFTFDERGELISFTTEDRSVVSADGTIQQVKWSVYFKDYKMNGDIKQPTRLQAVWNYEQGDLVYFDSDSFTIEYDSQ